jgi:hypothetical protein
MLSGEWVMNCKDGTEFPVEISLNPLLLDDVLHVIGAVASSSRPTLHPRLSSLV